MKCLIVLLVLLILGTAPAISQSREKDSSTKKELIELERKFFDAWVKADVKTLNKMLTADYFEVSWAGSLYNKEQRLKEVAAHLVPEELKTDLLNTEVVIYGNSALLMCIHEDKLNNEEPHYSRSIAMFVKQQDEWKKAAQQFSNDWAVRQMKGSELTPITLLRCEEESTLKSLNHENLSFIRFKNSTQEQVSLYWINYSGKRDERTEQIRPINEVKKKLSVKTEL